MRPDVPLSPGLISVTPPFRRWFTRPPTNFPDSPKTPAQHGRRPSRSADLQVQAAAGEVQGGEVQGGEVQGGEVQGGSHPIIMDSRTVASQACTSPIRFCGRVGCPPRPGSRASTPGMWAAGHGQHPGRRGSGRSAVPAARPRTPRQRTRTAGRSEKRLDRLGNGVVVVDQVQVRHLSKVVHGCDGPSATRSPTSAPWPGGTAMCACWSLTAAIRQPAPCSGRRSAEPRRTCASATGFPESWPKSRRPADRMTSPGSGTESTWAHTSIAGSRSGSADPVRACTSARARPYAAPVLGQVAAAAQHDPGRPPQPRRHQLA